MITWIDTLLDRITMYRLTLYVLAGFVVMGFVLAFFNQIPYAPLNVMLSTAFLIGMCWAANTLLARIFDIPTNVESAFITALILTLIIDPPQTASDVLFLGWAAILAMASKYILSINNKHIFNPAAIAVVITAVALHQSASWWVATLGMLPVMILGGLLIVRKLRQEAIVATFLGVALITVTLVSLVLHTAIAREIRQLVVETPLLFLGAIMLTEPLTAPPTRPLRLLYAALIGVLVVPQVHIGGYYFTPEVALVIGNLFAYVVSPKQRVVLKLKRKNKMAPDIIDFVFTPSQRLAFTPGQYLECTLGHPNPDSRGNRRFFTLASSPTEDTIHLGVRFYEEGSSFKRALAALNGQKKVYGVQVAGDFTLPASKHQKLAFIAGGIGITPYRSMLKYLIDQQEHRDIVVLYANRSVDDIVYKDVLSEAQKKLGIPTIFALTDLATLPATWQGRTGRVDEAMIRATIPDFHERTFYISGPPAMVQACEQVLRRLNVQRERIKTDFFPGLV